MAVRSTSPSLHLRGRAIASWWSRSGDGDGGGDATDQDEVREPIDRHVWVVRDALTPSLDRHSDRPLRARDARTAAAPSPPTMGPRLAAA